MRGTISGTWVYMGENDGAHFKAGHDSAVVKKYQTQFYMWSSFRKTDSLRKTDGHLHKEASQNCVNLICYSLRR